MIPSPVILGGGVKEPGGKIKDSFSGSAIKGHRVARGSCARIYGADEVDKQREHFIIWRGGFHEKISYSVREQKRPH